MGKKKDKKAKAKSAKSGEVLRSNLYELFPVPEPKTDALKCKDAGYLDTDTSPERVAYVCKWLTSPPYMSQVSTMALELIRAQAERIEQLERRSIGAGASNTAMTVGVTL